MHFAICCVTELTVDQINEFLKTDYEIGKSVTDLDDPHLVLVDDLEESYKSPTTSLSAIKGFPFAGMTVAEILPILRESIYRTNSRLSPDYVVILDEDSAKSSTALLAAGYRRSGDVESVRVEFGNCNVELVNLWVGGTSVGELAELAAKSDDGILRWHR